MSEARSLPYKKGGIPRSVVVFLIKAVVLFVLWKTTYMLVLKPHRILDDPLTRGVGITTTAVLNIFSPLDRYTVQDGLEHVQEGGQTVDYQVMDIHHDGKIALSIWDPCNALEVMVLYVGFIICFPSPPGRKWAFIGFGLIFIWILNILRCVGLVYIAIHHKQWLDFIHHFVFTFIVYVLIFYLWYRFTKKQRPNAGIA